MNEFELLADYACVVGEGPLWHPFESMLYWTDIDTGRMFRYDPETGEHEHFYSGETVGGFTLCEDGALLLFGAKGSIRKWSTVHSETLFASLPGEEGSRFNDVIADPEGRVFCGTMATGDIPGKLYRLDTDRSIRAVAEGIGCSNGMGFTPDLRSMYYTDSFKHEIYLYDYDRATGEISNQRLFARLPNDLGFPDGMTVDAEGCLWSAVWDGGCVLRFTPDGSEIQRVAVPAKKVSSVTFGGPDCADLYVTTAGGDKKSAEDPHAGALFRLRDAGKGVPEFLSRL